MILVIHFQLHQTLPVTLRIWEYVFSGYSLPLDSKETELGSSDQEASSSVGKNTGVVLVPCLCIEVCPYSYFWWCGYFWGPWVVFVMICDRWVLSDGHKNYFKDCCLMNPHPTFLFLTYCNSMNYGDIIKRM